jgi:hypothetical protein
VEEEAGQQKAIIDMVVMPESPAPKENGVQGAAAVENYGELEESPGIPKHTVSLADKVQGLKSKLGHCGWPPSGGGVSISFPYGGGSQTF